MPSHCLIQCWFRIMILNGITRPQWVNSLAPGSCGYNFRCLILQDIVIIEISSISGEITLQINSIGTHWWYINSGLGSSWYLIVWCHQAKSHYLTQALTKFYEARGPFANSLMCRDACRDRLPAVTGKTFPAFPAHAHPQYCVSGKRPMVLLGR